MDPEEEHVQRRLGTTVGDWKLERLLGMGGMSSVFLARREDGVAAAVKLLHPVLMRYPEARARFSREGPIKSALAAVGPLCEGLPDVYETGETDDGIPYLAMELLEGETLADRLDREKTLPIGQALFVAQRVLDVLVLAHENDVIHRDLKPENVFLPASGGVKVLDFGVARVSTPLPSGADLPKVARTKTGSIIGSARYMAPEQAVGKVALIDARTDLFGLGATLFHALAGRPIHLAESDGLALIAAATKHAPPLASVAPSAPADVCALVDRAVRHDRDERYPDARTMRADVVALRSGKPPPSLRR